MPTKVTRWSPDTCGCVIDFEWDSDEPVESRQPTPRSVKQCPIHEGQPAVSTWDENRGKNRAIAAIIEHAPDIKAEDIAWRWGAGRKLVLSAPGLGTRRSAALAAARRFREDVEIE